MRRKQPKEYWRKYYQEHSEEIKERSRVWHYENKERAHVRQHEYHKVNRERILSNTKKWKSKNHNRVMAHNYKRLALLRGSSHSEVFTREEIYERDNGICHICKRKVSFINYEIDHLIPVSLGGAHVRSNVAVAHPLCNRRRFNTKPAQLRLLGEQRAVYTAAEAMK